MDKAIKAELEKIESIETARARGKYSATQIEDAPDSGSNLKPLKATKFSEIEAKPVNWLWEPFLARGTFNIIEGEEGLGKTFIICAIAAAIAAGKGLPMVPEDEHTESSTTLLISAEDSLSHVLKPRLESMQADCEKIIAIDEPFTLNEDGILRLKMVMAEFEPVAVFIDPLFSFTGRINLNNDNEIRSITDALKRLAEQFDCCIVGIRHIGKSKGMGDARSAGLNGIGWRGSARSVLLVGKNPEDDQQKAICQTKNNLAPICSKSIGFEIKGGEFLWCGESTLTYQTMLSAVKNENTEERGEKQDAIAFLRVALRDGERASKDILAEARQCGISERTLHRAKKDLKVESRREGFNPAKWFWFLSVECHEDAIDCQINKAGTLQVNETNKTSYINKLPVECQETVSGNLCGNVGNLWNQSCDKCGVKMDLIEDGTLLFCSMGCGSKKVEAEFQNIK